VTLQQNNNTNLCERFLSVVCCCLYKGPGLKKSETFVDAREKVEAEMDLAEMIQAVRMTKFLRQLNEDKGYFSPLIAYSFRYRVNAPDFPQKEQDAKIISDNSIADALTGSNEL